MKYLVLAFVLITISISAQKRFINSLHIDFFGNQIDGDGYGGYNHVGVQGGIGSMYKLKNSNGAVCFEINYAQKGARVWAKPSQGSYDNFKFNLNYIEVPVFYVFEKWGLPFEVGPTFSYLLNAKREFNGIISSPTDPYRNYELGGLLSLNYQITKNLFFKFRVTNSISPILKVDNGSFNNWTAGTWHRSAGLNITYFFSSPNFNSKTTTETTE